MVTKERSKITTRTRDDDDDNQRPPPFTSSLLPPQEDMNCWMATWESVNRRQLPCDKSQGAHGNCCRFSPEVVPFEKNWYNHHNSKTKSTTMVLLPLATFTAHSATHPSPQAPPPHHPTTLTPPMNVPARRPLSGSPTPPTDPTRPLTTMEEMGDFSPILPLFVY